MQGGLWSALLSKKLKMPVKSYSEPAKTYLENA